MEEQNMMKLKTTLLFSLAAIACCAFAADATKPDARYLALVGVLHSESATLDKNIATIKKNLSRGPYGSKWRSGDQDTGHGKITQEDLETFAKNLAEVLECKNPAHAAGALKDIEAFADKLHDGCRSTMPATAKIAVLLAASKDAADPAVAAALLKRADKIKVQALAQISKSKGDDSDKTDDAHSVIEAYRTGLGLTDISEDGIVWLVDSVCQSWPDEDPQDKQVKIAKANKSCKLAESGIDVLTAVDKLRAADSASKAKAALVSLDKAAGGRKMKILSPNGSSRPTPEMQAKAKSQFYYACAGLVDYANRKIGVQAVNALLEAKAAEARRMAERAEKEAKEERAKAKKRR